MANINGDNIEELLLFARQGLVILSEHAKRLDDLEATLKSNSRKSEANAKKLLQLKEYIEDNEDRLHDLERWVATLQLQADLLTNKMSTGGLGKSIAQIDRKLEAMAAQREKINPTKTLNPLVPIAGLIVESFSLEEMDDLIFQAGENVEAIPMAKTAYARARNIVEYFDKQGQIITLLAAAETMRPEKLWPKK